jgi:hypothetical protein
MRVAMVAVMVMTVDDDNYLALGRVGNCETEEKC